MADQQQASQVMDRQRDLLLEMSTRMAEREAENANLRATLKQLESSPGRFVATPGGPGPARAPSNAVVGPSLTSSVRPIARPLFASPSAPAPTTMSVIGTDVGSNPTFRASNAHKSQYVSAQESDPLRASLLSTTAPQGTPTRPNTGISGLTGLGSGGLSATDRQVHVQKDQSSRWVDPVSSNLSQSAIGDNGNVGDDVSLPNLPGLYASASTSEQPQLQYSYGYGEQSQFHGHGQSQNHNHLMTTMVNTAANDAEIISNQRTEIASLHQRIEVLRGTLEELRQQRANQAELMAKEKELAHERERAITTDVSRQKQEAEREFSQRLNHLQSKFQEQEAIWSGKFEQAMNTLMHTESQLEEYRGKAADGERSAVTEHEKVVSLQYQLEERDGLIIQLEKARIDGQKANELVTERITSLETALKEKDAVLNGAQRARDGEVKRAEEERQTLVQSFEQERNMLQQRVSDSEARLTEMQNRFNSVQEELANVKSRCGASEQSLRNATSQLREVESANAALERQHSATLAELLQVQRELAEVTRRAATSAATIDESTVKAVRDLEQRVVVSEAGCRKANQELMESRHTAAELRDRVAVLEQELHTASEQSRKTDEEKLSSIARIDSLEHALEDSRKEINAKDAALSDAGSSVAALRSLQIECGRLREDNEAMKLEGDQLRAYNSRLAEEWAKRGSESAEAATNELRGKIQAIEARHIEQEKKLSDQIKLLESEKLDTQAALVDAVKERDRLSDELERMQTEAEAEGGGAAAKHLDLHGADVAHLLSVFQAEVQRVRAQADRELEEMKRSYERERALLRQRDQAAASTTSSKSLGTGTSRRVGTGVRRR